MDTFPTVHWQAWDADATFLPGDELPPDSQGRLYAVLVFLFYGDKVALADIAGRGYCIPSGRIEPGEALDAAAEREVWEETGGRLAPDQPPPDRLLPARLPRHPVPRKRPLVSRLHRRGPRL